MLLYDYEEVPKPEFFLEHAMRLYGLTDSELFWERDTSDTMALLAWGGDTVVLGFRGTASMANVKADLQVGSYFGAYATIPGSVGATRWLRILRRMPLALSLCKG